jgi:uncharacterized membrane protein (UPF0182 family)
LVLALLALTALLARIVAHFQTEWLWFHELGQEHVFWTLLATRWLPGSLAGLGTAAFLVANLWTAERIAPAGAELPDARLRRIALSVQLAVSAGAGLLVGRSVVLTDWQPLLLWLHRSNFGVTDPLFHKDVGFFVFSLPLYQRVAEWLLLTAAIALASAFAAHAANGGIRTRPSLAATRAAYAHLLGLGALLLVLLAWKHRLNQLALVLPRGDTTLPGAGYTTVHVQLPWFYVLEAVTLAAAAMLVYAAVRRSWSLPAVALVIVVVAELVNPAILPAVVQRLVVEPQTLSRERPYLADAIGLTQRAYALDRVAERQLPADARISSGELRSNRDVLRNVQLWDTDVLRAEIDQQQAIGSYYSFPNITVDRYDRGGEAQAMIVAERELDLRRLDPSGRTWANDRFAYTHGYGLVAVPAGDAGVDDAGKPRFVTSEFGAGRPPAQVREPRIYYGVQPAGARPWVTVRTNRAEVEKPLAGNAPEPKRSYDGGGGGIPMSTVVRRALFALRFGDLNLLLSETLGGHARMLLHRDVTDRLTHLAPFLHWDRRPEVAVVDGRILFLAHGYTTSDSYPYSAPIDVGGRQVNYMRGSVVATVDAFSGQVAMYVIDPDDPIARAWRASFPKLFAGEATMPADVRAHLRYPQELFDVQSRIWATYHVDDVDDFYTRVDAWKRPADISGPIQKVGTLATRLGNATPTMRPAYVLARLPGERRQQFMLTSLFTPYSEENLTGYLAGSVDASGRPRLTQLSLPRARRVLGPSQVSRQILAAPGVNDRLRLLNQETTDLGERAVNTVEISDPRVVPLGDSFLYVQSVYVTAQGSGISRLRLVAVFLNGRVGYGKNLDQALRRAGARLSLRRHAVRARTQRPRQGRDRPALRREDVHGKR